MDMRRITLPREWDQYKRQSGAQTKNRDQRYSKELQKLSIFKFLRNTTTKINTTKKIKHNTIIIYFLSLIQDKVYLLNTLNN
jgi:hypothetical protein